MNCVVYMDLRPFQCAQFLGGLKLLKLGNFVKDDTHPGRPKTSVTKANSRPRWLTWMRRPTGDQEVAGSTPAKVGNILSWRLIMKYFLRSFSPFR